MTRDPRVEAWLDAKGAEWRYHPEISIDSIDIETTLRNRGRAENPIREHLIETYALTMQDGAQFPALIGFRSLTHTGLWELATGVHRTLTAKRIARRTFDMYEVCSQDEFVRALITATANTIEGERGSRADEIERAKWLVRHFNRTAKAVAKEFGIPYGTLREALHVEEVTDRLAQLGVLHKLNPTVKSRLHALTNDRALVATANLISMAGLGTDDSLRLYKEVKDQRTEAGQLGIVTEWRSRPEITDKIVSTRKGQNRPPSEPKAHLFRSLSTASHLLDRFPTVAELHITGPEDQVRLETLWSKLTDQLAAVYRKVAA